MKNNEIHKTVQSDFLKNVSEILLQARKNAKTAVNLSMVYAYYEIGRMIVEEEQHGANRAAYGKQLLKELSAYLTDIFGKGFSTTNLKQMRQFYLTYVNDQISQTLSDQFETLPTASTGRKFFLSWSHYLKLMRIDNIDERHFYEIECVKNDWSLSELKRQYNSALYERIALSTDKDKVYRLAVEGQKVETPKDAVKDPYVLEFLGLKELPEYSESELESRIIDHLQQFLLELGTGFAFIGRQVRFTFDERDFAAELDTNTDVAVYVKLPDGFYISTPVGHYNPDWAIAFYEGKVKHIYFVAETKGSMSSMQLRLIEESKIHCAREHFKAISSDSVVYDVVDSYQSLLNKVMR